MARYLGPSCRVCRRLGTKLFLKGDKCTSDKCVLNKRKFPPGQRPKRMSKLTPYALQLKEKQKLKKMYGMLEKQFHLFFELANRKKGVTGHNLLILLETRLDNVVYRLSMASSRNQARQLVLHGHVLVNGKKVTVPSYRVRPEEIISVTTKSQKMKSIIDCLGAGESNIPVWLQLDVDKFEGRVDHYPAREEIDVPINEQTIVELYSK